MRTNQPIPEHELIPMEVETPELSARILCILANCCGHGKIVQSGKMRRNHYCVLENIHEGECYHAHPYSLLGEFVWEQNRAVKYTVRNPLSDRHTW